MYLFIPEYVLQSDLNADCKLVLSYLVLLKKSSRYFYGSPEYLAGLLGISASAVRDANSNLHSRGLAEIVFEGDEPKGIRAV